MVSFHGNVLDEDPADELGAVRAVPSRRPPVVLARREVDAIFHHLSDPHRLMAKVIYGCGLRLNEGLGLRVKDVYFETPQGSVMLDMGSLSRTTRVPRVLRADLDCLCHL